uniref:Uncharacterized protein n=1 Tax=Corethron hystrix TaxID=216773 RepID=A0A7S1C084_9STRA|mmetsp:Transcript_7362/g.15947  ORF Transcript_7362/g.15947 Transcript_7362/m.15947 type:complete len:172 (+) Transcript_7362:277-792(+)
MMTSEETCPCAVMCSFLPFGLLLLAADSYHDLRWCLSPSEVNAKRLRRYYTTILTPRLKPIPCPGFFFPPLAIYIFLGMCPDWIGWSQFALFVPLSRKYYGIFKAKEGKYDDLRGWWGVVAIRVILVALTWRGIVERGCWVAQYGDNLKDYLGLNSTIGWANFTTGDPSGL